MNQDFMMSGKAAVARKLVRLSRVATINLDPEIVALAKTDLLTDDDFADFPEMLPNERKAVQNLIDCVFRAVLPTSELFRNREIAMIAAKIAGVSPVIVIGAGAHAFHSWNKLAKKIGIEMVYVASETTANAPDPDLVRDKRNGLLLFDELSVYGGVEMTMYPNDFPRAVVLTTRCAIIEITDCVEKIFPRAPVDIISNSRNAMMKAELTRKGFRTTDPKHLAFLLNIVTDLIPDDQPVISDEPAF